MTESSVSSFCNCCGGRGAPYTAYATFAMNNGQSTTVCDRCFQSLLAIRDHEAVACFYQRTDKTRDKHFQQVEIQSPPVNWRS